MLVGGIRNLTVQINWPEPHFGQRAKSPASNGATKLHLLQDIESVSMYESVSVGETIGLSLINNRF